LGVYNYSFNEIPRLLKKQYIIPYGAIGNETNVLRAAIYHDGMGRPIRIARADP
jgi:hypothetical protein